MAIKLIALAASQPFSYQGRTFVAGDVFNAPVAHAIVLQRRGQARLAGALRTRDLAPEPAPTPELEPVPTPTRRRYRRRDLTAEPA